MSRLYPIQGQLRRYDWGGRDYINGLLGRGSGGGPVAEYWLGAHPASPSSVELDEGTAPLDALVASDPAAWLGADDARRFGAWPHLLKVLDVARPLSIQVHPDRAQARAGFEREEAAGLAPGAPERNFNDPNPKPELAVALEPFRLLFGLADDSLIVQRLAAYPSLAGLAALAGSAGGSAVFERVMRAAPGELRTWLEPVLRRAGARASRDPLAPEHWIARWVGEAAPDDRVDRGVFGFLLMNILELAPGEGIFQGPGIPHAYLEGRIIELMSNSDNVLRCGLTPKHVDTEAVLAHVVLSSDPPAMIAPLPHGSQPARVDYRCPVDDFLLSSWTLEAGARVQIQQPGSAILLVMAGAVTLESETSRLARGTGEAALTAATTDLTASTIEPTTLVMASVPD